MPVVWSDRHRLHDPGGEVWVGVQHARHRAARARGADPGGARGARRALRRRRAAARRRRARASTIRSSPTTSRARGSAWEEAGLTEDPGQDRVVPYLFPHPDLFSGAAARTGHVDHGPRRPVRLRHDDADRPGHLGGGARGRSTPRSPRPTLVLDGAPAAYACTRPPGHHATRSCFGGSCYLNNSAPPRRTLRAAGSAPRRGDRHRRPPRQRHAGDLLGRRRGAHRLGPRGPRRGLVPALPRLRGRARRERLEPQRAARAGRAATSAWVEAVAELAAWARGAAARGRSWCALGVDAAGGDPESPLAVTRAGFRAAGTRARGARAARRWSCRRAATTWTRSASWSVEALEGIEEGLNG